MSYNTKILIEQGGSVQRIQSTASLLVEQGGELKLSADSNPTVNQAFPIFKMGNNAMWYSASAASPTLSASPGDILWQPASASTALWLNTSNGTTGSKWSAVRLTTAGSQLT